MTLALDDFLERIYGAGVPVFTLYDTDAIQAARTQGRFFVLKHTGQITRPETLLVSLAESADALAENVPFNNMLQGLFASNTFLFMGMSLNTLSSSLARLRFWSGSSPREHFAIVAVEGNTWRAHAELLRRQYGIRVLPLKGSSGGVQESEFLAQLAAALRPKSSITEEEGFVIINGVRIPKRRDPEPGPVQKESFRLTRVILENIGPFDSLKLELDPNWNVFLGDNGVGKSSILKAIALGIVGRDAQPYAHRIIKQGCASATITLETLGPIHDVQLPVQTGELSGMISLESRRTRQYITKLFKTETGAEVASLGSRLIDGERVLTIGFPALRTVTWQAPKTLVTDGSANPSAGDLLPLISGEPDPRMDRLKQWIANLQNQIDEAKKRSASFEEHNVLRRKFNETIEGLLPDSFIRLGEYDTTKRQLNVTTPEGDLPIEAVSQGTTSVIGWVGVVLLRLLDLYPDDPAPWDREALVLIDEIDAHLHPAWQRTIIQDVSRVCPNIQFIGTTHSPLVVGGLMPQQIYAFHRHPQSGRAEEPIRPRESFIGYRADQILTSSVFNFEVKDPETREIKSSLPTTISPSGSKLLDEYRELLATSPRSEPARLRLLELTRVIEKFMPLYPESVQERDMLKQEERALLEQLDSIPQTEREELIRKADEALARTRRGTSP